MNLQQLRQIAVFAFVWALLWARPKDHDKPAIAQLAEHLTVDLADIRWSLVRFRVAGFASLSIAT